jgi:mercuric ion transport protein
MDCDDRSPVKEKGNEQQHRRDAGNGRRVATNAQALRSQESQAREESAPAEEGGLLISGNFIYVYAIAPQLQLKSGACDPNDPAACQAASRISRIVLWCSAVLYLVGCFTAYILGPLLFRFNS